MKEAGSHGQALTPPEFDPVAFPKKTDIFVAKNTPTLSKSYSSLSLLGKVGLVMVIACFIALKRLIFRESNKKERARSRSGKNV